MKDFSPGSLQILILVTLKIKVHIFAGARRRVIAMNI